LTDMSILDELEGYTLTPIICTFCGSFVTYTELDLVLHFHESHRIGRGYLDTPPTPFTPSRSWSDDYRIRNEINEGKKLGRDLDEASLQRLNDRFLIPRHEQHNKQSPTSVTKRSLDKNSPIISIDEFFKSDNAYSALCNHSVEQSPCYPIIGAKSVGIYTMYYCELCHHPRFENIHLSSIEHHCKYKDPDRHRLEILVRMGS